MYSTTKTPAPKNYDESVAYIFKLVEDEKSKTHNITVQNSLNELKNQCFTSKGKIAGGWEDNFLELVRNFQENQGIKYRHIHLSIAISFIENPPKDKPVAIEQSPLLPKKEAVQQDCIRCRII